MKSRQFAYRSPAALASALAKTASTAGERSGRRLVTGGGGSESWAYMTAIASSRWNGGTPVSSSKAAQASAYSSARPSTGLPSICSGEM